MSLFGIDLEAFSPEDIATDDALKEKAIDRWNTCCKEVL